MAEVIAHKYVKTRKPHNCFGCAREFPKGSILNREAVEDGGSVFTAYMCPDCEDYLDSLDYSGDEFCYGDLRDAVFESFYESDYCPKCGALMDGDTDD